MYYKVFISTAGIGSRILGISNINKSLLPVKDKAAITRIINKFPKNIEIVIALGYQKNVVKDFLKISFPKRKFRFVNIDKFKGKGSGPGYTLLKCKKFLQCPFIYSSCDTIVEEKINLPNKNWLGISKVSETKNFLIVKKIKGYCHFFDRKKFNKNNKHNAFIGLAGIFDYKKFWAGLTNNKKLIKNEIQISNGLTYLNENIELINFTWNDTGSVKNYKKTLIKYKDQTLLKPDTFIYFNEKKVIKYFSDSKKILHLKSRAFKLKKFVPKITEIKKNFLTYNYQNGKLLSNSTIKDFDNFVNFLFKKFWRKIKCDKKKFSNICNNFYKKKTYLRVQEYFNKNKLSDKVEFINNNKVAKLYNLLDKVNWKNLSIGIPVNYHGDLQPENILVKKNKFILIDWRDRFGKSLNVGDIYYEFSKLDHALEINGEIIRKKKYKYFKKNNKIFYSFEKKNKLLQFRSLLHKLIILNNYDIEKVKLLTSLIFLNIAFFYEKPYSHLLFSHGKLMLSKTLKVN